MKVVGAQFAEIPRIGKWNIQRRTKIVLRKLPLWGCLLLGIQKRKRKKYKKALECFQEMEKFSDEKEIEDDYNYGITLFYCGYFEKAKEMLLRCYEKEPESAGILYALALCLHYTNDKKLAEPILDKLLEKVSLEKYYYDCSSFCFHVFHDYKTTI